jgi:hypothetical protein
MFPEFTARTEFPRSTHPGTVTFVGPDGEERVEKAEHLPDWLKFAPGTDGTPVPVVKVVRLAGDRAASLRSYGVDGQLLWVGLSVPPAQSVTRLDPPVPAHRPTNRLAFRRPSKPVAQTTGWF